MSFGGFGGLIATFELQIQGWYSIVRPINKNVSRCNHKEERVVMHGLYILIMIFVKIIYGQDVGIITGGCTDLFARASAQ